MKQIFKMDSANFQRGIAMFFGLMSMASISQAMGDGERQWQQNVLTRPSQQQLALEQKGHIVILDGLTDKTVENVLDTQFQRLGSMMFTRVVITDAQGRPKKNLETGETMTEDDGC